MELGGRSRSGDVANVGVISVESLACLSVLRSSRERCAPGRENVLRMRTSIRGRVTKGVETGFQWDTRAWADPLKQGVDDYGMT